MTEASTELEDAPRPLQGKELPPSIDLWVRAPGDAEGTGKAIILCLALGSDSKAVVSKALALPVLKEKVLTPDAYDPLFWFAQMLAELVQGHYFSSGVPPTTSPEGAGHKLLWPLSSRWDPEERRGLAGWFDALVPSPQSVNLENQRVLAPPTYIRSHSL